MNVKLNPLQNRVVIRRQPAETKSLGGLFIPDAAKKLPEQGQVVGHGPACSQVKLNDKVIFQKYAGTEVNLGEPEPLLIMSEDDLLAIIEE